MQKVERRQHRTRRHRRLAGLLICAALLAGCVAAAFLMRRSAQEEPPARQERQAGAVTRRQPEELVSLTLIRRDGETWTADMEDGVLRLRQEEGGETGGWTVDENVAAVLQDAAVNLTYEDVFTENREDWEPHAADFGLDRPLVTAVIRFTDGEEVTARIGDSADPDNDSCYYMTVDGDDRLFAVASGTVQDLNTEKALLHPVKQPEIRRVLLDRITIRDGEGNTVTEWRLQGKPEDQDAAENWLVTAPFVYPADYDSMKNLRESAESLRMGTYIGEAEEETLVRCGLDHPTAVMELHMAAGSTGSVGMTGVYNVSEWPERTVTLTVGGAKSEMTDYVLFEGEVYTLSRFTLSAFTETPPMETAARYPVATPLNSLESLRVEREGEETVLYSLVRTENLTEGEAGEDGETAVRCLRNGEEIPYEVFSAAYERILTVTVSGTLPEGWQTKDVHTKYTFRTVSGGTHTLELSDYDGMHDAVTMDGHTLFYLIRNGMTELP